jgi:hypothetical protein
MGQNHQLVQAITGKASHTKLSFFRLEKTLLDVFLNLAFLSNYALALGVFAK